MYYLPNEEVTEKLSTLNLHICSLVNIHSNLFVKMFVQFGKTFSDGARYTKLLTTKRSKFEDGECGDNIYFYLHEIVRNVTSSQCMIGLIRHFVVITAFLFYSGLV